MNSKPWIMLMWLLLLQLTVAFVGRSIGPLAPFIADDFHLTKAQVGLLPSALFIGQSLVSIPAGWFSDRWGTRKMLMCLAFMQGMFFLLASYVPFYSLVLFCIVMGGFGYGAMHPTSSRGIILWFPVRQAGTAMGIKQTGVTAGSALAALLLIPFAESFGWRWAMGISTLLLVVIGILTILFYRDPLREPTAPIQTKPLFMNSLRQLAGHRPFLLMSLAAMGLTSAQLSLTTYLVFYVSDALLYPLVLAGVFLFLSEIGGSLGRVAWGVMSDRFFHGGRLSVLILIAAITSLCSLMMAFIPPGVSLWVLVPLVLLFGFCIAGYNGIWMNAAAESVPREYIGLASGFSLSIGSIGVILGPPIFGAIVDITGSFTMAWLFMSVQMVLVIGLLIWSRNEMTAFQELRKKDASVS